MAETRRVSSARPSTARRRTGPRPALPHPPRHLLPSRPEGTAGPRPVAREEKPAPAPAAEAPRPASPPRRTASEQAVLALLLTGLLLNALALLRPAALSRADQILGATVLVAGVALLVLMEVYRRAER